MKWWSKSNNWLKASTRRCVKNKFVSAFLSPPSPLLIFTFIYILVFPTLSLSLPHTHTYTHTLSIFLFLLCILSFSLSLFSSSLPPYLFIQYTHTHTHTHTLFSSITLPRTHARTHIPPIFHSCFCCEFKNLLIVVFEFAFDLFPSSFSAWFCCCLQC